MRILALKPLIPSSSESGATWYKMGNFIGIGKCPLIGSARPGILSFPDSM